MTNTELQKALADFIESVFPDQSHYLVSVSAKPSRGGAKVTILADSDNGGITIETCAAISRQVNNWLEEANHFNGAYTLEVSSPGTDYPLQMPRMFTKNIGRELQVVLKTGVTYIGPLVAVTETGISVSTKQKEKGKKPVEVNIEIPFEHIAKATVQVNIN